MSVTSRGTGNGKYLITLDDTPEAQKVGEISVTSSDEWKCFETEIEAQGKQALYLHYEGSGAMDLFEITFSQE